MKKKFLEVRNIKVSDNLTCLNSRWKCLYSYRDNLRDLKSRQSIAFSSINKLIRRLLVILLCIRLQNYDANTLSQVQLQSAFEKPSYTKE